MGFLDGIRDVVGGFNAVKRIDDTGFDWREQDAAQQFARDRQVEEARQQDEDRAVNQIADAYAGAEGGQEPDVSPLLQGIEQRRQKFMLDRARGVGKERKSALEEMKTYRDMNRQYLQNSGRIGAIEKTAELKAPLQDDQQAAAMERLEKTLTAREREGTLDREMARTLAEIRRSGAGGGARKPYWNVAEKRTDFLTGEELAGVPQGTYTDITTGRQNATKSDQAGATGKLIQNVDSALTQYEKTQEGMGRVVPSMLSPSKAVAWDRYQSTLQSAAQMLGRKVLQDNRVSDQDRQAYAKTIGQTSEILTMLDPGEARRRLDLLKSLDQDYEAKYGGGGEGEQQQGGHGPAVKRRRLPTGRTQYRDAQGNVWEE